MSRLGGGTMSAAAFGLLGLPPLLFVVWAVWATGESVHPIDVRLALVPWGCLAASVLGLTLASVRLMTVPRAPEGVWLGIGVGFGVCEVLAFAYIVAAVAFGIPAAP